MLRARQRRDVINGVLSGKGFEGIVESVQLLDLPWTVAQGLFEVDGGRHEGEIIPALLGHSSSLVDEFAKTYVRIRLGAADGRAWAESRQMASWTTAYLQQHCQPNAF